MRERWQQSHAKLGGLCPQNLLPLGGGIDTEVEKHHQHIAALLDTDT